MVLIKTIVVFLNLYYTFITYDWRKRNEKRAKGKEHQTKSNEQRTKSKKQQAKSNEQQATIQKFSLSQAEYEAKSNKQQQKLTSSKQWAKSSASHKLNIKQKEAWARNIPIKIVSFLWSSSVKGFYRDGISIFFH